MLANYVDSDRPNFRFGRTFWQREGTEVSDKEESSAELSAVP